jgi:hypothetical protein
MHDRSLAASAIRLLAGSVIQSLAIRTVRVIRDMSNGQFHLTGEPCDHIFCDLRVV